MIAAGAVGSDAADEPDEFPGTDPKTKGDEV